jgi:drug/metabolite transporter (DMT)-like permease
MARPIAGAVAAALGAAVLCDVAGSAGALPPGWPTVSYVLVAVAIAGTSAAVLSRVLHTRSGADSRPLVTLLELAAAGLLLGSWLLRGHREIPPDRPLIAAQVVAALLLAAAAWRRRPRPAAATGMSSAAPVDGTPEQPRARDAGSR